MILWKALEVCVWWGALLEWWGSHWLEYPMCSGTVGGEMEEQFGTMAAS